MNEREPPMLTWELLASGKGQSPTPSGGHGMNRKSPELSPLPGMRMIAVPEEYRVHQLVHNRLFFTLPPPLLKVIVGKVGKDGFDAALLELEYALADQCGDHTQHVGFWKGQAICYGMILPLVPLSLSEEQLQELAIYAKKTPEQVLDTLETGQRGLAWNASVSRGYLGWLLTSPTFLQEHDDLFTKWERQIWKSGVLQLGPLVPEGVTPPGTRRESSETVQNFAKAFEDFYIRWRLNGLVAPYLPTPLTPKLSRSFPLTTLEQLQGAGGIFFIPDTYPVPSRDQFRQLLEDSLRGDKGPEHLVDWTRIVRRGNAAKTEISSYARIFELQHYWWILHQRHSQALNRKLGRLKEALASFLKADSQTIHRDLLRISKRLGPDWVERLG